MHDARAIEMTAVGCAKGGRAGIVHEPAAGSGEA